MLLPSAIFNVPHAASARLLSCSAKDILTTLFL